MPRTLGSNGSLLFIEQRKQQKEREDFERYARACGYLGALEWDAQIQSYKSTHETAMFAGFRMGLKFKEADDHAN